MLLLRVKVEEILILGLFLEGVMEYNFVCFILKVLFLYLLVFLLYVLLVKERGIINKIIIRLVIFC